MGGEGPDCTAILELSRRGARLHMLAEDGKAPAGAARVASRHGILGLWPVAGGVGLKFTPSHIIGFVG